MRLGFDADEVGELCALSPPPVVLMDTARDPTSDVWVFDPQAAVLYAHTHEQTLNALRKPKLPPHWLRCEYMLNGVRCRKGEGHERLPFDAAHEAPK